MKLKISTILLLISFSVQARVHPCYDVRGAGSRHADGLYTFNYSAIGMDVYKNERGYVLVVDGQEAWLTDDNDTVLYVEHNQHWTRANGAVPVPHVREHY